MRRLNSSRSCSFRSKMGRVIYKYEYSISKGYRGTHRFHSIPLPLKGPQDRLQRDFNGTHFPELALQLDMSGCRLTQSQRN
jgi:hypothetical protein